MGARFSGFSNCFDLVTYSASVAGSKRCAEAREGFLDVFFTDAASTRPSSNGGWSSSLRGSSVIGSHAVSSRHHADGARFEAGGGPGAAAGASPEGRSERRLPRRASPSPPAPAACFFVFAAGFRFPGRRPRGFASAAAAGAEAGAPGGAGIERGMNGALVARSSFPAGGEGRDDGGSSRRRHLPAAARRRLGAARRGCRRGAARPPACPGAGAAAPARGRGRRLRRGHPKRRNARWGATSHRRGRDLTEIAKLRGACHARPRARRGRFVLPVRAERTRRARR